MKTKIHIDDYLLKIESESMDISIKLHKHEQAKQIIQLTKDITEMVAKEPSMVELKKETKPEFKRCPTCNQQFKPRSTRSTYCSPKCGQKAYSKKYSTKNKSNDQLPKHNAVTDIEKTLAEIEASRKQPYEVSK